MSTVFYRALFLNTSYFPIKTVWRFEITTFSTFYPTGQVCLFFTLYYLATVKAVSLSYRAT